jgi:hypothetical protein
MWIHPSLGRWSVALLSTFLASFAISARAQTRESQPISLESEVTAVRAENGAIRDQLRKLEEQQQLLLQVVDRLQQQLDGRSATVTPQSSPLPQTESTASAISTPPGKTAETASSQTPAPNALNTPSAVPQSASTSGRPKSFLAPQGDSDLYSDGIVIAESSEDATVPFLLKFNINTQIRYLNTLDTFGSFTDHLGVTHAVNQRNDITVNRAMFIFSGYIFDKRALYSYTVWTSAGSASIVTAGNIGWRFNKALALTGGYTGVPGSRSLVGSFPFWTAMDRSMADNFFRPGFTQGAWLNGELGKGLNYIAFVGNGLNTLSISANKIDENLLTSGSVWWEPLGPYGPPGKSRNMYDDYFSSRKLRIRLGTSFTRARENRFSDLDQSSPENTSIYNSDGVQAFATGAFALGVTLQDATYRMLAVDGGIKWNGLAVNGQYYMRWLDGFVANGPLPLASTFDQGGEFSAGYYVEPKRLMPYVRTSWVLGQFGNSYEYGGGVKWNFVPSERLWFSAEVFRVNKAPYSGAFTPYTAGLTGWVPMLQAVLAF